MVEHFPLTAKKDGIRMSRGKAMLCPHYLTISTPSYEINSTCGYGRARK